MQCKIDNRKLEFYELFVQNPGKFRVSVGKLRNAIYLWFQAFLAAAEFGT